MASTVNKITVISFGVAAIVAIVIAFYANTTIQRETDGIVEQSEIRIATLSALIEERLDKSIRITEFTSTQPQIRGTPFADYITEEYLGIPEELDIAKRQVAKDVLTTYDDFEVIRFTMPTGEMYLLEPYANQLGRQTLSMAHRDWFKSAIIADGTDISEVFKSQATGNKVVSITVPVKAYDDSLLGLWSSNLDLTFLMNDITNTASSEDSRVILVDHNGNEIFDSGKSQSYNQEFRKISTESYTKTASGQSGTLSEYFDDQKMFVAYHTLNAGPHNWMVLMIKPHDEVFSTVNSMMASSLTSLSLVIAILAIAGYFNYRNFSSNALLTAKLEKANEQLKTHSKKLKEVDRAKDGFTSMITHELKTPLVPISGYSELLLDGTLGNLTTQQKEKIKIIQNNTRRLSDLIQDVLDVHKLELHKMKFDMQETYASTLLKQCTNTYKTVTESKNIALVNTSKNDKFKLKCDPKRILQVLNNLVGNSIKFVPENDGKIEISAENKDSSAIFMVKDNGIGIPKEKQSNLFKKFYQVDTSLNRNAGGTGLGLAISKGIVDSHNGKIWVESKDGKGLVVYFSIPTEGKT